MNIESVEKCEIFPTNPPANNAYSFKNGFPNVSFQISNQDKLLNTRTLRLNGVFRLQTADGNEATPQNFRPENTTTGDGAGSARNGISLNSRVGIPSCIQQITIATQSNQTLEVIRQYGRYLASVIPVTHSQSDLDTNQSVGNPASSSRSFNSARAVNQDVSFSIPLRCGLFNSGKPIPLGTNGLRGLLINLELAPDSNVISGFQQYVQATSEPKANLTLANPLGTGPYYQMRDLSITYDLLIPDETGKNSMTTPSTGQFIYNSVSQLYGVLNSSDQTINYNLGTQNTISLFSNFIPTTFINRYNKDGFSTGELYNSNGGNFDSLANIKKISFIRGGLKFPLDYTLDIEKQGIENRPQTESIIRFIDSIKPINAYNHSLISLNTQNGIGDDIGFENLPTPINDNTLAEPNAKVYGVGINLDPLTRSGVNYKNTNYGLRIESELDGNNSPNSIFTYVIAKNILTYSPNGIIVQS